MADPTVSVVIPTYNRLAMWRDYHKLLDVICQQEDPEFECIIVDDNSPDGTAEWLVGYFKDHSPRCRMKVCKCKLPKSSKHQVATVSSNIGIKEATGDILVHLNDDLNLSTWMVSYLKSISPVFTDAVVYGLLVFCDEGWKQLPHPEGLDSRYDKMRRKMMRPDANDLIEFPADWRMDWGAAYAVRRSALLEIGGYDLDLAGFRGADSRMGFRLRSLGLKSYLCTRYAFTAFHYGDSWYRRARLSSSPGVIQAATRSPSMNMRPVDVKVVANGGKTFWQSDWFNVSYSIVGQWNC